VTDRPRRETPALPPLHAEASEPEADGWRSARVRGDEVCRWESTDGRWVTLRFEIPSGTPEVVIEDWGGRRRVVESYEEGLKLARRWRTSG
jgi:hypothetical protein